MHPNGSGLWHGYAVTIAVNAQGKAELAIAQACPCNFAPHKVRCNGVAANQQKKK